MTIAIIPVPISKWRFNQQWPDIIMPLSEDLNFLQYAIVQASMFGVEAIYVIAHIATNPLIKKGIGEYIMDPVYSDSTSVEKTLLRQRYIPIHFMPVNAAIKSFRESVFFYSLHGVINVDKIYRSISRFVVPNNYIIIPPYSVFDYASIRKNRRLLKKDNKLLWSYNGETIKDGIPLPFIITYKEALQFEKEAYENIIDIMENIRLSKSPDAQILFEEYMRSSISFERLADDNALPLEVEFFYNVDSWESYRKLMANKIFRSPPDYLFKYREFYPFGEDKLDVKN